MVQNYGFWLVFYQSRKVDELRGVMLKSSTHIGSKDIRPTMHINDRVLLGRMYIFMAVSCRSCIDKVA